METQKTGKNATVEEKPVGESAALNGAEGDIVDDDDDNLSWSSDSEIAEALDWLDLKDDNGTLGGAFAPSARRPNAHGGLHSRPNSSALQPVSNRSQKLTNHIRASPLEEWEGRVSVGMSSSVTASIRSSAIGKTRTHDKADRATVELVKNFPWKRSKWIEEFNIMGSYLSEETVERICYKNLQDLSFDFQRSRSLCARGHGYSKHNPRKMVQTWAEKELRNLLRLKAAGISMFEFTQLEPVCEPYRAFFYTNINTCISNSVKKTLS